MRDNVVSACVLSICVSILAIIVYTKNTAYVQGLQAQLIKKAKASLVNPMPLNLDFSNKLDLHSMTIPTISFQNRLEALSSLFRYHVIISIQIAITIEIREIQISYSDRILAVIPVVSVPIKATASSEFEPIVLRSASVCSWIMATKPDRTTVTRRVAWRW